MIEYAVEEILPDNDQSRAEIDRRIKRKERAIETLVHRYQSNKLKADDIRLACYSICDNNSYLNSDRLPIDKMLDMLDEHYLPDEYQPGYSLAIVQGTDTARLNHSHEQQFHFARQVSGASSASGANGAGRVSGDADTTATSFHADQCELSPSRPPN